MFKQEYPASPEEAFIATGACVFDTEKIIRRINDLKDYECKQGGFEYEYDGVCIQQARFTEDVKGCIKIFKEPIDNTPYTMRQAL